jgi:uncharacterized protein
MESHVAPVAAERSRRAVWAGIAGLILFAAVYGSALSWAKWQPYWHKLNGIRATGVWPGHDILAKAGAAQGSPSLHGAWAFTTAYANAVWMAIVAGLLIAASIEALLPRKWLLRILARRTRAGGAVAGGLLSLPSLMCTCCTAPVAASLRRSGASVSATLAYWLGNPVLNPAVLVFLALVAPWQWVTTRAIAGVVLVFAVTPLVARLTDGREQPVADFGAVEEYRPSEVPRRFVRSLARLALTLLPEYAVVVFLVGLFRGWLFPFAGSAAHWGVLAVVLAALLGTLVVIPTGGEIPIVQGLALAGLAAGVQGALLVALPAISIVSMAMVVRQLSVRVTLAAAVAVAAVSVAAGALLAALS